MVSLQKYTSHGQTYWRLVESRRVNGKPTAFLVEHIGTSEKLVERLQSGSLGSLAVRSYEHGNVAVLWALAQRFKIPAIIDRHAPESRRDQTIGTTLALGATHRALSPGSKRSFARWARTTSLPRIVPGMNPAEFTSQYFWDQMDALPLEALPKIEDEITQTIVHELGIPLDTLLYDVTNFFTFIASDNTRAKLPQRGHNKQHRTDLRQFNLALLVSRDGEIPLANRVYEGNTPDVSAFQESLTLIRERITPLLNGAIDGVTLVYDRGNNSKENQAKVDASQLHYVAALTPAQHTDLLQITKQTYTPLPEGAHEGVLTHRLRQTVWGAERTLVLYISEQLRDGQIRGLQQHLTKRVRQLEEWKQDLAKPRSGPKNDETLASKLERLQSGQHIREILHIHYDPTRTGSDRLSWEIDDAARTHLHDEVFGKRILMTNRHEWETPEIIQTYIGQYHAENTFRQLKDTDHLAIRPQYHWTDQKIRIHTFLCLQALLLTRALQREAKALGIPESADALLDRLQSLRLARLCTLPGPEGGRPRVTWKLEDAPEATMRLYEHFVPPKMRSVYTAEGSKSGQIIEDLA
ncbi:MAG: IS1634 family transposase [Thermoplasmatota archaeon]